MDLISIYNLYLFRDPTAFHTIESEDIGMQIHYASHYPGLSTQMPVSGYRPTPNVPLYSAPPAVPVALPQQDAAAGWNVGSWLNPLAGLASRSWQGAMSAFGGIGQASFGFMQGLMTPGWAQGPSLAPIAMPQLSWPGFISVQNPSGIRQIATDMGFGARKALEALGGVLVENAPAVLTFAGTMAASTAVCSFMGGTMAATGAVMLGQHLMNGQQNPHGAHM